MIGAPAAGTWQPITTYDGSYGVLLAGGGYTIFGAKTAYGWVIIADDTEYEMPGWEPTRWAVVHHEG